MQNSREKELTLQNNNSMNGYICKKGGPQPSAIAASLIKSDLFIWVERDLINDRIESNTPVQWESIYTPRCIIPDTSISNQNPTEKYKKEKEKKRRSIDKIFLFPNHGFQQFN